MRGLALIAVLLAALALAGPAGALIRDAALSRTYAYANAHCVPPGVPGGYCRHVSAPTCLFLHTNAPGLAQWGCAIRVRFGTFFAALSAQTDQIFMGWDPYGRLVGRPRRIRVCLC